MTHLRSRRGPALAVPVVLSPTASPGFVSAAACAVPAGPYDGDGDGGVDATRAGGRHANGFHGPGVVDALRAVE
ncbi:hypothetical protein ACIRQQ_18450 [Streptomyces fuscichromogenes]|uniref:hypothetical protein n=1 Tax=Streptomyces fuscichromogenes TaxID=1324013 RepID=UPI00381A5B63